MQSTAKSLAKTRFFAIRLHLWKARTNINHSTINSGHWLKELLQVRFALNALSEFDALFAQSSINPLVMS